MSRLHILVVCGGRSTEHNVSLLSASSIVQALDPQKYTVLMAAITGNGRWQYGPPAGLIENPEDLERIKIRSSAPRLALVPPGTTSFQDVKSRQPIMPVDVVFPIVHGTDGEDGSLQGMLEMLNLPYVGAGVFGSALGMNKVFLKRLLEAAGLPIARFVALKRAETTDTQIDQAIKRIGLPLFVKPVNLGSSIAVQHITNRSQISHSIREVFRYDNEILFEEAIDGQEIECSVLGNNEPLASMPARIIPNDDFYSYRAKYVTAEIEIPAAISPAKIAEIQKLAVQACKILNCQSMARVDFFLRRDGQLIVNELNTLPGFTATSVYPKLWEASGLPYPKLLDRLIELALERQAEKSKLKRSYQSPE